MRRRFKTNISSDELKTIAATSAIAAAGGALATALVTYALDKWILKSEAQAGPTFVVVPVVEREIPPLPAIPQQEPIPPVLPPTTPPLPSEPPLQTVGFGMLTKQQRAQVQQLAPWRYWQEFYKCWEMEDPKYRDHCRELSKMWEGMSDDDAEELDNIVSSAPYVGKKEFILYMAVAAGGGVAAGMLIANAMMK